MGLLVKALQGLAGILDKYIPAAGARHIVLVVLAVVAHVSLFLTGQETAEQAAANIGTNVAVIFAALHKPTPPSV